MTRMKSTRNAATHRTTEPRVRGTSRWATKAVLERRTAVGKFVQYAERIAESKDESRRIMQEAGISTASGRLSKHYK